MRYDATRRVLVYRGFMSSGSYGDLRRLSTDPAYVAALDALYVGIAVPAGGRRAWRWLMALIATGSLAAAAWVLLRPPLP